MRVIGWNIAALIAAVFSQCSGLARRVPALLVKHSELSGGKLFSGTVRSQLCTDASYNFQTESLLVFLREPPHDCEFGSVFGGLVESLVDWRPLAPNDANWVSQPRGHANVLLDCLGKQNSIPSQLPVDVHCGIAAMHCALRADERRNALQCSHSCPNDIAIALQCR